MLQYWLFNCNNFTKYFKTESKIDFFEWRSDSDNENLVCDPDRLANF